MTPRGVLRIAGTAALDGLPDFRPRAPWYGGDLQTLRNQLIAPPALPPSHRERHVVALSTVPGQTLTVLIDRPAQGVREVPLICLLHGLGGSEESRYVLLATGALLRRGYAVARLGMRGAGISANGSRGPTHAGLTADLRDTLRSLAAANGTRALHVAGFSLGGHQVLRLAAEGDCPEALQSVVAISAPLDLAAAADRIAAPRNAIYAHSLVRAMRAEARRWLAPDDPVRARLGQLRSVRAFDGAIVAPAHGFRDADDYYHKASMQRLSAAIAVPTLVIHAADDPWIPSDALRETVWPARGQALVLETASGGHVGFHADGLESPWYVAALLWWIDRLGGR